MARKLPSYDINRTHIMFKILRFSLRREVTFELHCMWTKKFNKNINIKKF